MTVPSLPDRLRIGTRGSPLARVQAEEAMRRLVEHYPALGADGRLELVVISTTGDAVRDRPLAEIGGKGLFTKEIDRALADGRVDVAVHSVKDLETRLPDGLAITAVLPREDPRDVLLGAATRIDDLAQGAVVGTVSLRRQAQLLERRPDLRVVPLRGNVDTRIRKVEEGEIDAAVLALAGLRRLGRGGFEARAIPVAEMLPAVGQGAIGIQRRTGDAAVAALLAPLNHPPSALCVAAERALLDVLDGSCRTPIGGLAVVEGNTFRIDALVAAPDGSRVHRAARRGAPDDAERLARDAGAELRAAADPAIFADA